MKTEAERLLHPFEQQMGELGRQVLELDRQNDRNKTSVDEAVKTLSEQTAALLALDALPNWCSVIPNHSSKVSKNSLSALFSASRFTFKSS